MAEIPQALRENAAAHEAGHAVVAWQSPFLRCVLSVNLQRTLVFSADAPVLVEYLPDLLFQECRMRLAGLAGEMSAFGKCRSGWASDDLVRAVAAARRLISCVGWSNLVAAALRDCSGFKRLDIGAMFSNRPPLAVARCLDAAYLSARNAVSLRLDEFNRLRLELAATGQLDFPQIAKILGATHIP